MTRKGIIWYTVFSFLLVTLLIFTAVMITYNAAVKKIGATYAKQLAVASKGFELDDVTDLDIKKTYFDGNAVFEVSFNKDSEKHIVYVDTETARIANKSTGRARNPSRNSRVARTDFFRRRNIPPIRLTFAPAL